MKLSTSLNVYSDAYCSYEEMLLRASKCGFTCFDFNPGGRVFYNSENWRENTRRIKEYADSLGVAFTQSHVYCFNYPAPADADFHIRKTIEAASIAGVPWAVMHPFFTGKEDRMEVLEENIRIFEPYIEYAKSLNVGIAIENMYKRIYWFGETVTWTGERKERETFTRSDDLICLVDALNAKYGNVGVCWDTGHAHLSMDSQYEDIVKLGSRLKVLHIADNAGQADEHLPSFYGYVNWKEIMRALDAIDYQGTFNFEVHNFTRGLPDELKDDAVRLLYKIGEYVVHMNRDDSK
ncbi:MAG: sugar phosphate isomerase/epimerase [Lachnospiraceae bacterium]|nr:sugar phosphate isomerase/epimerase [Lachnospiraceae bacterium]